jgi:DNA-binding NtrC family response regulator
MTFLSKVQRLFPDVPVIVMTALGSEREQAALYGGAYAYLEKPLYVNRFIAVVRAALEKSAACLTAATRAC